MKLFSNHYNYTISLNLSLKCADVFQFNAHLNQSFNFIKIFLLVILTLNLIFDWTQYNNILTSIKMIKYIFLAILISQVLNHTEKRRVNYIDQVVLREPQTAKDISVTLNSLPGNDDTVPIKVQLREISDVANPLAPSTVLDTQSCVFVSAKCNVTFTAPVINSASRYSVRLLEQSIVHNVAIKVKYTNIRNFRSQNEAKVSLTPLGADHPGFKFYIATAGTWTTNFKITSYPAPTVSSFDFKLSSFSGNQLNTQTTQSVTQAGDVSFTIATPGFYYLSFSLTASTIDAQTRYPIELEFSYTNDVCPTGQFYNRQTNQCQFCSNIANSLGTTTVTGVCDCAATYFWNFGQSTCVACPASGCPIQRKDDDNSSQKTEKKEDSQSKSSEDKIKIIIDDFNNGNLRGRQGRKGK